MRHLLLLAPLALAACVEEPPEVSGAAFFAENCTACHGADGRRGPAAEGLDPPPPDLTTISARNGGTFPRDYVMSVIDGYTRGEHFNPAMPEFGALDLGETVVVEETPGIGTPVPVRLLALADYLEGIQR